MPIIRMITVARNASPHPNAIMRSMFLSSAVLAAKSGVANSSSEVVMRMRAVTASHRLRSDAVKGKYIRGTPPKQSQKLSRRRSWPVKELALL